MDREDNIYRKALHNQDLAGLAELCGNVAAISPLTTDNHKRPTYCAWNGFNSGLGAR
jgi:hypothetical protein